MREARTLPDDRYAPLPPIRFPRTGSEAKLPSSCTFLEIVEAGAPLAAACVARLLMPSV